VVQTVTIPLSWANNIPGVSGVQGVTFDLPETDNLDSLEDIAQDAADLVFDGFADAFPGFDVIVSLGAEIAEQQSPGEDPLTSLTQAIATEIAEGTLSVELSSDAVDQSLIDTIVSAVAEEVNVPGIDEGQLGDEIGSAVADEIPDISIDGDQIAETVVQRFEEQVQVDLPDPQEIANDILQETDGVDLPAPQVNISGVFGPLATDVVSAFNQVLSERLQAPDIDLPDVSDVERAVSRAVEEAEPTVNGAGFFSEPVQFAINLVSEAVDQSVSQETEDQLNQALEE